jgi:hypothetical protein
MHGRSFLRGIIDYAGLFPPASLGMAEAVRAYASYRSGPDRDLLGRFISPAGRLGELSLALNGVDDPSEPWRISVISGPNFVESRDAALEFNARQSRAACDAIEVPAASAAGVEELLDKAPEDFAMYVEIPVASDPAPLIAALAGTAASAKIRTGGITQDAIPSSEQVLRLLIACRTHRVPFKATAGLHHVIRAEYPLTYESDAPLGTMFGYLNIFLAAAALEEGWNSAEVLEVLDQRDLSAFQFDDEGAVVNGRPIPATTLASVRSGFARSFGSCSFTEPVSEARAIGFV